MNTKREGDISIAEPSRFSNMVPADGITMVPRQSEWGGDTQVIIVLPTAIKKKGRKIQLRSRTDR